MKGIFTGIRRRGMAGRRIRVAWLLAALACGGPGACAWLSEHERQLVLRPTPGAPADPDSVLRWQPDDRRYTLPSASEPKQTLALWWLPQADPAAPTLLYLHGTLRSLYGNAGKIEALRALGFSVLAVDYRGWGDSSAIVPSEASIVADAWQAWADLVRRQPDPRKRVIFGHSMGSAVAVQLASTLQHEHDYGALALEAAFSRLPDVAAAAGFWGRIGAALTTLQFDSAARIGRVDAPIWMLHGSADNTVPVAVGRRLRDLAPAGVHWVEVAGGSHSRLQQDAPAAYARAFLNLQAALLAPATASTARVPTP